MPRPGRQARGSATSRNWKRIAGRIVQFGTELLSALPRDLIEAMRRVPPPFLKVQTGEQSATDAKRLALYVHYSTTGRVSALVLFQLKLLLQSGFAIVFISMSEQIPADDWQSVRHLCALVVQRRNFGRDFGAWKDLMPDVARRWPELEELLLVNDSVLGPVRDFSPVIDTMRGGGEGLFGLTESHQGGPHLQSYLLLARGRPAVADLMRFVGAAHISHSKWLLIRMTEIRLARWMRQRGHRVAAVFGYARLIAAAASDPATLGVLEATHERFKNLSHMPEDEVAALFHRRPLNPTHHLWHLLITRFGYPYLKTELVLRNPGGLPNVAGWPAVVGSDSPCDLPMLLAHLETLKRESA